MTINISAFSLWLGLGTALATAQVSSFQHVVVIVQENRSTDNLFQGLCAPPYGTAASCSTSPGTGQYNIQTKNWKDKTAPNGITQPSAVVLDSTYDLSHSHTFFTAMCDPDPVTGVCKMDGAAGVQCIALTAPCPSKPQYRYVDNSTGLLNPYLDLATQYGWANYMFQTNQGPSFPAHQFIFGLTSAPSAADDAAGIFAGEQVIASGPRGTHVNGCIATAVTTVQLIGPDGIEQPGNTIYPCFEHQTLADVLPPSVTWKYYAPNAGSDWTAPNAIQHICESSGPSGKCQGQAWIANVDLNPPDVLTDISNCTLRSVSWVIPSGGYSDHPGSGGGGPSWVTSIVNAIGNSSTCDGGAGYWNDTAILITWDDWGGWYDHVAPQILASPQGGYQYGFRVPLIFVSAYTPKGHINNSPQDFGSFARFIEHNFGIQEGVLNFADARAKNNLSNFFNLKTAPRAFQTIAAPLSADFFLNDHRPLTDPDNDGDDQ